MPLPTLCRSSQWPNCHSDCTQCMYALPYTFKILLFPHWNDHPTNIYIYMYIHKKSLPVSRIFGASSGSPRIMGSNLQFTMSLKTCNTCCNSGTTYLVQSCAYLLHSCVVESRHSTNTWTAMFPQFASLPSLHLSVHWCWFACCFQCHPETPTSWYSSAELAQQSK